MLHLFLEGEGGGGAGLWQCPKPAVRFPSGANHPGSAEPSLPAGRVCLLDNVLSRAMCWFPDVRGSREHLFHRSRDVPPPSTTAVLMSQLAGAAARGFWGSSPHQPHVCSATKGFFFSNRIDQSECCHGERATSLAGLRERGCNGHYLLSRSAERLVEQPKAWISK